MTNNMQISVIRRFLTIAILAMAGIFACDIAAQESQPTVIFSAQPANVVSITANTTLLFVGETAGTMTATVIGVTGTMTGNSFVPDAENATSTLFVTLHGLSSCNVGDGCGAFGLENANNKAERLSAFLDMELSTVTMFAASGADLNEYIDGDNSGFLIFHVATANMTTHAHALITLGADVNITNEITDETPLHRAVTIGQSRATRILLTVGADVNAVVRLRRTALHYASQRNYATVISILLEAGANVNPVNHAGVTPFFLNARYAGRFGTTDGLSILIAAGASVNATGSIRDCHDCTPLDVAIFSNENSRPEDRANKTGITYLIANGGLCSIRTDAICPNRTASPNVIFSAPPNKTFIIRTDSLANTPGVIGVFSPESDSP